MTIKTISAEKIWFRQGYWDVDTLNENRIEFMLSAVKSEVASKQQKLYQTLTNADRTTVIDYTCAYCGTDIEIVIKKIKKWWHFTCHKCKPLGYSPAIARHMLGFYKMTDERLQKNLS